MNRSSYLASRDLANRYLACGVAGTGSSCWPRWRSSPAWWQCWPCGRPARQGHPLDTDPVRLVCAAKTFGFDPPEATTVDQVRVVYAHHMCAAVAPGLTWPGAIRVAGPVAVTLTEPATVRLPERALPGVPDATQLDRVRSIIPERYHRQALAPDGLVDPDVAEQLRTRFEAAIRNAQ